MQIDRIVLGEYENNAYIVRKDKKTTDCIVIDTGLIVEPLIDFLKQKNLNPLALILTHGHADHIAGAALLLKNFSNIKICIHKADLFMLADSVSNFSKYLGRKIDSFPIDVIFKNEGQVEFADLKFAILHTPGHTPGGICLYNSDEKILFTGDTLFAGSVGRTVFPGYDVEKCSEQLINNIKTKLLVLPDDTAVLPGHGPVSTIGQEKLQNSYLR
ncbi:MAG: MBL fold metallo-hydrolase [Sedimentisphaerales bacterium]|jgi:glyoxylase-like metal-dependent hydrolase (beta-lactamase superfamily II)